MDARNLVVLGLPLVSCFTIADAGVAKPLPLSKEAEMLAKLMQRPLKSSAQQMSVVSFNMLLKGRIQVVPYSGLRVALLYLDVHEMDNILATDSFCESWVGTRAPTVGTLLVCSSFVF